MRHYSNHTAVKLIIILLLILIIIGIFIGTDIIVHTITAIANAVMPSVICIVGIYIVIKGLFK